MSQRKKVSKGKKLTRREFLKTASATTAAVGGSLAFPSVLRLGEAAGKIKIGCIYAVSGHMSIIGRDNVEACKLAVEEWNEKGGVLGKEIELIVKDDQANPGLSSTRAKELIEKDKVNFLLGGNITPAAGAIHAQTAPRGVVFIATCMHNDLGSVPMFSQYTFHKDATMYALGNVMGRFAATLGLKWYFLVSDYGFGWQNYEAFADILREAKGENLGVSPHPPGTLDYSSYIGKIMAAKPEVLVTINAGKDQVNSWKQLREFGAFDAMEIVGVLFMPGTIWSVGIESVWGGYGGATFYWEDDIPATKKFTEAYWKRWDHPPSDDSSESYEGMMELLSAIERAKSTKPEKIIKEMEGNHFGWTKGEQFWRPCDHEDVQDIYALGCKKPTREYDTFKILDRIGGEKIMRTCETRGHKKDKNGNWIRYQ
jgi:branched-chain amino acid transport system substrate-binding protein